VDSESTLLSGLQSAPTARPYLKDAFKKTEAQMALQTTGRMGGASRDIRVLVGGRLMTVSDARVGKPCKTGGFQAINGL
jgi:hypothetical protein